MARFRLFADRRGQALVEFALILPLFLMLLFGVIEFGRILWHHSHLDQAARETLRLVSIGADRAMVKGRLIQLTVPLAGNCSASEGSGADDLGNSCTRIVLTPAAGHPLTATITPPYSSNLKNGDSLRVALRYRMDLITPLSSLFGPTRELQAIYVTLVETPPQP
ncbi:hypothetical protein GTO89_05425 [Heliobacterium gestii]|uniref:TadE-like domain-containing protein n=1 Tax=Heliomicrobium gestii TaxID=2699 RepID=A0A845LC31_HELGE|nr:TadE family protein [Heliomicrobium gestii]MBM7866194.1 hypothetical protein [Heliomicrobium gestii]MZP42480.1 hypothetical protein [Heliomicrobium gestii]